LLLVLVLLHILHLRVLVVLDSGAGWRELLMRRQLLQQIKRLLLLALLFLKQVALRLEDLLLLLLLLWERAAPMLRRGLMLVRVRSPRQAAGAAVRVRERARKQGKGDRRTGAGSRAAGHRKRRLRLCLDWSLDLWGGRDCSSGGDMGARERRGQRRALWENWSRGDGDGRQRMVVAVLRRLIRPRLRPRLRLRVDMVLRSAGAVRLNL
jgi:hypothetical protein